MVQVNGVDPCDSQAGQADYSHNNEHKHVTYWVIDLGDGQHKIAIENMLSKDIRQRKDGLNIKNGLPKYAVALITDKNIVFPLYIMKPEP